MRYATLMVHLQLGQSNAPLLKLTSALAARLGASVTGIVACQPMRIVYSDGYVPPEIIDQDRKQIDDDIAAARSEFVTTFEAQAVQTDWRSLVTHLSLSDAIANEARCADLVITGVDRNHSVFDDSRHVDIGDLVMRAGRPCLIVPASTDHLPLAHVVVGWKDSGETRRAVGDALPILKAAGRVTVTEVTAADDREAAQLRLQDVVAWLKRHDIAATPLVVTATGNDAAALGHIIDGEGADLLVAGAYGHSRVREWVLGGVTRDLLLHARYCALVSH